VSVEHITSNIGEYHARPEWSSSQVKMLPDDVVGFYRRHITGEFPFKQTASTKLGDAVHRALLDGAQVMDIPPEVLSKNGAKAGSAWTQFAAENSDKVLVKADDPIKHMVASVRAEPAAMRLLEAPGWTEHTLVYRDEETGLWLRTRPDRIIRLKDGLVLPDIKSTKDPLPGDHHFGKEIATLDYHRQAAWYRDGVSLWLPGEPMARFAPIAVRNAPPYECVVHDLDEDDIDQGQRENRRALEELKRRLESGDWNLSTHGQAVPISLPKWRKERNYDFGG